MTQNWLSNMIVSIITTDLIMFGFLDGVMRKEMVTDYFLCWNVYSGGVREQRKQMWF